MPCPCSSPIIAESARSFGLGLKCLTARTNSLVCKPDLLPDSGGNTRMADYAVSFTSVVSGRTQFRWHTWISGTAGISPDLVAVTAIAGPDPRDSPGQDPRSTVLYARTRYPARYRGTSFHAVVPANAQRSFPVPVSDLPSACRSMPARPDRDLVVGEGFASLHATPGSD